MLGVWNWPCSALFLAAVSREVVAASRPCPPDGRARSLNSGEDQSVTVVFENNAGVHVNLAWVSFAGVEAVVTPVAPGATESQNTFPGHMFKARDVATGTLLMRYEVPKAPQGRVYIQSCDGHGKAMEDQNRWPEFEALVHDSNTPCVGPSSNWSCVRYVSPTELEKRDKGSYGYAQSEIEGTPYQVGQTVDHMFAWQDRYIMNVTPFESGYLKMGMTEHLKKVLYPWFHERKLDSMSRHSEIPGGFTNNKHVYFDIVSLDSFPQVKAAIVKEMRAVLEWWTKMRLRHSTTFGIRIYRRDAMLVDHLDRQETHIASAILQVSQKVDPEGGWPVEVIHPHRPGRKEVYLQPGEMLLYEGARLAHGRPMRFKGKEFSNAFVHFAPLSWYGLDKSVPNPHYEQLLRHQAEERRGEL